VQKVQSLISLLVIASVLALCLPLFDMVYLYPATTSLISENARKDAEHIGSYLAENFIFGGNDQQINQQLRQLTETFSLVRASLRSSAGQVLYSTAAEQVGQRRDLTPLRRALRRGESYSRYFFASPDGQKDIVSLVETQAPLVRNGELVAVLELIHDMGSVRSSLDRLVAHASTFLLVVAGLFFAVILLLASMARKAINKQNQTEQLLRDSQLQLEEKHQELNSLFQQVEHAKFEWQMTLDCIADLILLVDAEDKVRRCNEALVRFVGLSYLGVLGKNWKTILFAEGVEVVSLNRQHSEIYHPRHNVWLAIEFYPYQVEQGEKLTVVRIQKLHERRNEETAV
jgi:PAS domain-containing protein